MHCLFEPGGPACQNSRLPVGRKRNLYRHYTVYRSFYFYSWAAVNQPFWSIKTNSKIGNQIC